jgi:hypothetical protein
MRPGDRLGVCPTVALKIGPNASEREQRSVQRQFLSVVEALGETWAEQPKDAKDELSDEVLALRIELAELQTTLAELRQAMAAADIGTSNKIIDLPNPFRSRAN